MVSSSEIVAHTQNNGIMVSRTIIMKSYVQKHLINDETNIKVVAYRLAKRMEPK